MLHGCSVDGPKDGIILESSVEREKDVQGIDVHREFEKSVVTLLVMSIFSNFLGALRACADFRDSTEESRIMDLFNENDRKI